MWNMDAALSDPGCSTSNIYTRYCDCMRTNCLLSAKMYGEKITVEHVYAAPFILIQSASSVESSADTCRKKSQRVALRYVHTMPRSTQRQGCAAKVAPCHKYMWMLRQLGCGKPFDAPIGKLSVTSKEAARHMMSKGFQNVSASLRKKSDQVRRSRSTVLVTWKRSAKNSFFMWTRSHWWHMPSNFCRAAKLQCVAFCHAG